MGWFSKTNKEKVEASQGDVVTKEEITAATTTWRCSTCGWETVGEFPPEHCPLCGAPREDFVKVEK
ncbi:MAG: hypothetical protein HYY20_07900 [Candidatus Tectomicrobia bacterium]|uniref:Rubredoxin-like domain-containing protein n=1 Tax=Tectimicrobiota bacterium TaxID=2528274 RepID=A0A932CP64_UNCTE|nr:hypothetical protein [Candidatus Tectomicrobia bacterium]